MSTVSGREKADPTIYPDSDGQPMAETERHYNIMVEVIATLKRHYQDDENVYVHGNMLLYYVKGDPTRHVSPDVMFTRGIAKKERRIYQLWIEKRAPQVVIEITSSSTRSNDQTDKLELYRDTLGIKEYFLFDPFGDYLKPRLKGYRLRAGIYREIKASEEERLQSKQLGLELSVVDDRLRFFDPISGLFLVTPEELERERANLAEDRASLAEERADRLARMLRELGVDPDQQEE
jgi:Uma2 family endonuclease